VRSILIAPAVIHPCKNGGKMQLDERERKRVHQVMRKQLEQAAGKFVGVLCKSVGILLESHIENKKLPLRPLWPKIEEFKDSTLNVVRAIMYDVMLQYCLANVLVQATWTLQLVGLWESSKL
jgi:hypothetical protein